MIGFLKHLEGTDSYFFQPFELFHAQRGAVNIGPSDLPFGAADTVDLLDTVAEVINVGLPDSPYTRIVRF